METELDQEELREKLEELNELKKVMKQRKIDLEKKLETFEERERRRQDIIRSIVQSVGLDMDEHVMDTDQPSNQRFKKEGLRKVDEYIKELEERVEEKSRITA